MNRLWRILPVLLLLLAQPAVPMVLAHGGNGDGHHETSQEEEDNSFGPNAVRLTPGRRYVEQTNPATSGTMVVWQERELGREWDVVAKNLSTNGSAFAVTVEPAAQTQPVVQGPWIAWVQQDEGERDVVVLNIRSGEQIEIPDGGQDATGPTIGDKKIYWQVPTSRNVGYLRGFDLVEHELLYPIENRTIVAPPVAHGPYLAWAEGDNIEAKVRVQDTRSGETWSAPGLWALEDGPAIGRWGVAFIADVRDGQEGTYTQLFNWTKQHLQPFRTGKYPHENVDVCPSGVVWDQFAPQADNAATVAIWDGYTGKIGDFGYQNHDGTCTLDSLIYEKVVPAEDDDLGNTRHLYILDLVSVRPPAKTTIEIDPGLEDGIYQGTAVFTGDLTLGDPRQPLREAWARVDGGELQPAEVRPTGEGTYSWRVEIDTSRYFNGQHTLKILTVDDRGTRSEQGFRFFTHGTYQTREEVFDQPLRVPVKEASPFPFSIVDHYQDHQPFYNTILLILGILALIAYFVFRWLQQRPPAPPEYVPPKSLEDSDDRAGESGA